VSITIIVKNATPGRYTAHIDNELICTSRTPFFAAARVLQSRGVPNDTRITMRHEHRGDLDCLTMTVGKAAGLTVVENDKTGPRLGKFVAFPDAIAG
jgi:hypothetical protein